MVWVFLYKGFSENAVQAFKVDSEGRILGVVGQHCQVENGEDRMGTVDKDLETEKDGGPVIGEDMKAVGSSSNTSGGSTESECSMFISFLSFFYVHFHL